MFRIPEIQMGNMTRSKWNGFPRGPIHAMMSGPIRANLERQAHDYLYRLNFVRDPTGAWDTPTRFNIYVVPEDYYFHLEEITIWIKNRYEHENPLPIGIQVFQVSSGRELCDNFVGAHTIMTPDSNIEIAVGGDCNAPIKHNISWNYLFLPNDKIKIVLQVLNADIIFTSNIAGFAKGIRIPIEK